MNKIEKKDKKKSKNNVLKKLSLPQAFYIILSIIDVIIIMYSARHNYANYATINKKETFFVGDVKDLLFGKNYISLIVTIFFFTYTLLLNKFLFHKKNTKLGILKLFLLIFLINTTLFFLFTKRIY